MFTFGLATYSGAAKQADRLARALPCPVVLFDKSASASLLKIRIERPAPHYTVIFLPRVAPLRWLVVFLWGRKARVFHFHGFVKEMLILGILLRKKLVLKTTLVGVDDFQAQQRYGFAFIRRRLIKRLDANIVQTQVAQKVNSELFDAEKIVVVPNMVSLSEQQPPRKWKNKFVFAGVICKRKAPHKSIEYFLRNYSAVPDAELVLAGPSYKEGVSSEATAEYFSYCQSLIPREFSNRITFIGIKSSDEMRRLFEESLALLFFSEAEGLPNVVLEAMAANCVPIVSPLDGVSGEIIESGVQGFIVGNLLDDVVNMTDIRRVAESGLPWKRARDGFGLDSMVSKTLALYRRLGAT